MCEYLLQMITCTQVFFIPSNPGSKKGDCFQLTGKASPAACRRQPCHAFCHKLGAVIWLFDRKHCHSKERHQANARVAKDQIFSFYSIPWQRVFEYSDSLLGNFLHETTALGVLMPAWEPHPKRTFKDTAVIVPFPRLVSFGN